MEVRIVLSQELPVHGIVVIDVLLDIELGINPFKVQILPTKFEDDLIGIVSGVGKLDVVIHILPDQSNLFRDRSIHCKFFVLDLLHHGFSCYRLFCIRHIRNNSSDLDLVAPGVVGYHDPQSQLHPLPRPKGHGQIVGIGFGSPNGCVRII